MNSIFATRIALAACLVVAGASAQAQQGSTKKDEAPKLKQAPAGIVCAKVERTRHTDDRRDRVPRAGVPVGNGETACPDTLYGPKPQMA
jgi:hypothetical protein